MMSQYKRKACAIAYTHLVSKEEMAWGPLDDSISYLEYLNDGELHREADVIYENHSRNNVKCDQKHTKDECFIPILMEAVGAILELYKETGNMHANNRYILQYYLAMSHLGMIVTETSNES